MHVVKNPEEGAAQIFAKIPGGGDGGQCVLDKIVRVFPIFGFVELLLRRFLKIWRGGGGSYPCRKVGLIQGVGYCHHLVILFKGLGH
jgi:hypothetical protein